MTVAAPVSASEVAEDDALVAVASITVAASASEEAAVASDGAA